MDGIGEGRFWCGIFVVEVYDVYLVGMFEVFVDDDESCVIMVCCVLVFDFMGKR